MTRFARALGCRALGCWPERKAAEAWPNSLFFIGLLWPTAQSPVPSSPFSLARREPGPHTGHLSIELLVVSERREQLGLHFRRRIDARIVLDLVVDHRQ